VVCQEAKPEVVDLGEKYAGQINFVRINVDNDRATAQRYGVRATPTFIVLDVDGQVIATVPGWPGYDQFVKAFDQMLGQG